MFLLLSSLFILFLLFPDLCIVSTSFHPAAAGAGGIVESFAGGGEEFAAPIGEATELAARRACVARHPGASLAGGIIHTFRGDGKQLVAIGQQVEECSTGGTAVARHPRTTTAGRILDPFCRDAQHLFSVVD